MRTIEKESEVEEKYLEKDELNLVLKEIKDWPKVPRKYRFSEGLELMSLTGLREMAALKDDDILGNQLRIDETLNYENDGIKNGKTGTPKNSYSNRTILLSNRAIEIIKKWQNENEFNKAAKSNYVDRRFLFCDFNGYPIYIGALNRILGNISSKLKQEGKLNKRLTTHIFRHTHISQLAEMRVPVKTIMARVGHNNPNTTLNIYSCH